MNELVKMTKRNRWVMSTACALFGLALWGAYVLFGGARTQHPAVGGEPEPAQKSTVPREMLANTPSSLGGREGEGGGDLGGVVGFDYTPLNGRLETEELPRGQTSEGPNLNTFRHGALFYENLKGVPSSFLEALDSSGTVNRSVFPEGGARLIGIVSSGGAFRLLDAFVESEGVGNLIVQAWGEQDMFSNGLAGGGVFTNASLVALPVEGAGVFGFEEVHPGPDVENSVPIDTFWSDPAFEEARRKGYWLGGAGLAWTYSPDGAFSSAGAASDMLQLAPATYLHLDVAGGGIQAGLDGEAWVKLSREDDMGMQVRPIMVCPLGDDLGTLLPGLEVGRYSVELYICRPGEHELRGESWPVVLGRAGLTATVGLGLDSQPVSTPVLVHGVVSLHPDLPDLSASDFNGASLNTVPRGLFGTGGAVEFEAAGQGVYAFESLVRPGMYRLRVPFAGVSHDVEVLAGGPAYLGSFYAGVSNLTLDVVDENAGTPVAPRSVKLYGYDALKYSFDHDLQLLLAPSGHVEGMVEADGYASKYFSYHAAPGSQVLTIYLARSREGRVSLEPGRFRLSVRQMDTLKLYGRDGVELDVDVQVDALLAGSGVAAIVFDYASSESFGSTVGATPSVPGYLVVEPGMMHPYGMVWDILDGEVEGGP